MNKGIYYDIVCIGAGPSGLALAQMCCKLNKKILIIDQEDDIGGCHRVRRQYVPELGENMFTEHGPRVYSETYITFRKLLNEMGVDFYDLFQKYNFNITEIGGETVFSTLSFSEILSFVLPFLYLIFNDNYGIDISLYQFMKNSNFNEKSFELIDRICLLVDGGDSTKFTLNEFLQLFNQQFFYSLFQPKLPNDKGLFKIWKEYLINNNVDFLLNTKVDKLNINQTEDLIESIDIGGIKIYSDIFVFAIPPKNLNQLVKKNNMNYMANLDKFANNTAYYDYISFTFHWDTTLDLKKIYGFPLSDWGIGFVKLSDYMNFDEKNSKTVISITLTRAEHISKGINKTANECTFNEIANEVYLELKKLFGDNFIFPTIALLSPGVKYDNSLKKWVSYDTAYISSAAYPFLPFKNDLISNMYNLGTHNGKSLYKFTSLESAVSNSVYLSKILYPELNDPKYASITIEKTTTLTDIIFIIFIIIIVIIFILIRN